LLIFSIDTNTSTINLLTYSLVFVLLCCRPPYHPWSESLLSTSGEESPDNIEQRTS